MQCSSYVCRQTNSLPTDFHRDAQTINYNLDDTTRYSVCQEKILYIVFGWKFSEQNHKIYLYIYNTAIIRVSGHLSILVRIIAVLFPFCRIKAILMRIIYGFYAYKAKRILVIRIKWYRNAELIRIYGSRFSLAACSISRVN